MNEENTNLNSMQLEELLIADIIPSGENPRTINEKSAVFVELTESIQAVGVRTPVHVRVHPKQESKYELLDGERRFRASTKAGCSLIPAINHGKINDVQAFEITFIATFGHEDLTPIEQGKAVVTLLEKYYGDTEAVASKMGKSIKWIRQRQALGTKLSQKWKKVLAEDISFQGWTASHLQRIAALPEPTQLELLEDYNYNDPPTLKELDNNIAEILQLLSKAPFDVSAAGCTKCLKRTSCQPGLFDDNLEPEALKKNDRCLDRICWGEKTTTWLKGEYETQKKELPGLVAITTEGTNWSQDRVYGQTWGRFFKNYRFDQARKKDKGAMPGFIIFGKALGTVLWIKLKRDATESMSGKSTGKPTPLKERRDMLNRKRWARVLRDLVKEVEKKGVDSIAYEFSRLVVMALAGIVGTWKKHDCLYFGDGEWVKFQKIMELVPADPSGASTQVVAKLWEEVRPVLTSRLTCNDAITRTPDIYIAEAKNVAGLLGIDIDALYKTAETEYQEPKSWENLNADGTPKKTKKDKKKPATKKKTAKSKQKKGGKKNAKS